MKMFKNSLIWAQYKTLSYPVKRSEDRRNFERKYLITATRSMNKLFRTKLPNMKCLDFKYSIKIKFP